MVGVARIELATPAMSTPVATAKLLIFQLLIVQQTRDLAHLKAVFQSPEFNSNQSNTVEHAA